MYNTQIMDLLSAFFVLFLFADIVTKCQFMVSQYNFPVAMVFAIMLIAHVFRSDCRDTSHTVLHSCCCVMDGTLLKMKCSGHYIFHCWDVRSGTKLILWHAWHHSFF